MSKKSLLLIPVLLFALYVSGQVSLVDNKGTKYPISDSSKWFFDGVNIFNKNPGNVGVGVFSPSYKLDVFAEADPLRLLGLQDGTATDSILVMQNGVVKKIASLSTYIINNSDSTTASNGLSLVGNDVRLGGFLTQATVINNNGNALTIATNGNPFNITGLATGTASTDSLVTVQNGLIKKIAPVTSFISNNIDSTTASNGLNLIGKDVRLGGVLREPTMIIHNGNPLTFATNGNPFNISGLQNGLSAIDSLVTVQNGLIRKIAPIGTFLANRIDSTTASNGLNLVGKDVRLGGNLMQATSINNNGNALFINTNGSALNITGLVNGLAATDSLVTVQNGLIRKIAPIGTFIANRIDSTTASNGLSLVGKDVRLGGVLIQPTTIATNGNTLSITGLPAGVSATDSLMVIQSGVVKKIAPISSFGLVPRPDSTTASNGLNMVGKDVRLGGNLTQATTVTSNGNALTFATAGTPINITGLPSAVITDSVVMVNNATGQIRKIPSTELQEKVVEIYDAAGTQVIGTAFTNLNLATTSIIDNGFTATAGAVTVATAGIYKITLRVTTRSTGGPTAGTEASLTLGGVVIPGTTGYVINDNGVLHGTITIVKTMNLAANSVIAGRARRSTANGAIALSANGSSLTIEKIR